MSFGQRYRTWIRLAILASIGLGWWLSRGTAREAPPLAVTPRAQADTPAASDVPIPGGAVVVGNDAGPRDAQPARRITLAPFTVDRTEVNNAQFAQFVEVTGYVTDAERRGEALVFDPALRQFVRRAEAHWRQPLGPGSSIIGRENHPVVQVTWFDANAYAQWAGKQLPTEFQWEAAARHGLADHDYPWASEQPSAKMANLWQGEFPVRNEEQDGFGGTAPVGSFPPGPHGLSDLSGNVAEWTASWYAPDSLDRIESHNPRGPITGEQRVVRGGSWISSDQTGTSEAMIWYRSQLPPEECNNFTGFRCVSGP